MAISRGEEQGSRFAALAASAAVVNSTGCFFIVVSVSGWIYGGLSARLADHPAAADHDDADSAPIAAMGAELLLAPLDKRSLRRLAGRAALFAAGFPRAVRNGFPVAFEIRGIAAFVGAEALHLILRLEGLPAVRVGTSFNYEFHGRDVWKVRVSRFDLTM